MSDKAMVAGAGLWGCVIARRLAERGVKVQLCDKRSVLGGNCASAIDKDTGIEVHLYGSHIFHTDDEAVLTYLERFTKLNGYKHSVMSFHGGKMFQMPIGIALVSKLLGCELTPAEAERLFADREVRSEIFSRFFEGYTRKQWGTDKVDPSIIDRIPFRANYDTNYFHTIHQGIPECGYEELFRRIVAHENITVELGQPIGLPDIRKVDCNVYYSGALDSLFGYEHGRLSWRTISLRTETLPERDHQGVAVVNYPELEFEKTRIHEYKHYHPEWRQAYDSGRTIIQYETPSACGERDEPFYPVSTRDSEMVQLAYLAEARKLGNLHVGGRLGGFKYIDMAQAIRSALDYDLED